MAPVHLTENRLVIKALRDPVCPEQKVRQNLGKMRFSSSSAGGMSTPSQMNHAHFSLMGMAIFGMVKDQS